MPTLSAALSGTPLEKELAAIQPGLERRAQGDDIDDQERSLCAALARSARRDDAHHHQD